MFFDSDEVEDVSFEPLAKGIYLLTAIDVEYGPNSSATGDLVKVTYSVEGQGERQLFDNFNIKHSNPKAEKIGRGQFKAMLEKAGRPKLQQPQDLIGSQLGCEVTHREYNGNIYANIKKYFTTEEARKKLSETPNTEATPIKQGKVNDTPKAVGADDIPF